MLPHYLLTMGDPTGIGAEITLKVLYPLFGAEAKAPPPFRLTVVGAVDHLAHTAQQLGWPSPPEHPQLAYHAIAGHWQQEAGLISYQAVAHAVQAMAQGEAQGLVTGPICKANLWRNGVAYAGHTEMLEALAKTHYPSFFEAHPHTAAHMIFVYEHFRLLLLSRHLPLAQVPAFLSQHAAAAQEAMACFGRFLSDTLHCPHPTLALLGLNPHAGEIGGTEEAEVLLPLMERLNASGQLTVQGPHPADAFFRRFDPHVAGCNKGVQAVVACYHDQGLIPMKLLGGLAAVNVTIGLPFLRTSVSHGVAQDVVGQGVACHSSLLAALTQLHQWVSPAAKG